MQPGFNGRSLLSFDLWEQIVVDFRRPLVGVVAFLWCVAAAALLNVIASLGIGLCSGLQLQLFRVASHELLRDIECIVHISFCDVSFTAFCIIRSLLF